MLEALGVLVILAAGCAPNMLRLTQDPALPTLTGSEPQSTAYPDLLNSPNGSILRGSVLDAAGSAIEGAVVRVQATETETITTSDGAFVLVDLVEGTAVTISAWHDGYYVAKAEGVVPPADDLVLTLNPYQTNDNPDYTWIPPLGEGSCYSCKPGVTQVWLDSDAHARSATNQRFLSMYYGTDVFGNQSPLTRFGFQRDYGSFPLRPDLTQPYYGPGYRLDFPETAGNCAVCHLPGAAVDNPYGVDLNAINGVDEFGIHCDFCHKIANVRLDPQSGLPYSNTPGVLSMDIRRPFPQDPERFQLFFGTFDDDNVPEEDTYLPLIEESAFCAPCHFGVFWDTIIYNSYGEWLESPYSDPANPGAQTCQQCHMPAPTLFEGVQITNVAPEAGGIERDPMAIHAHTFPGASSEALLENAVSMEARAVILDGSVQLIVTITNDRTGHHVPTDSPLRHLILLVQATDSSGESLSQIEGPTLPEWTGVGDPAQGYYAGLPGTAYARILQELWTEASPTGAYWMPTRISSDNRLPAFGSATTTYRFALPDSSAQIMLDVSLFFRRAYIQLMDQKGWEIPDILMEQTVIEFDKQ